MAQKDVSAGKGICHEAWWPAFHAFNPHERGNKYFKVILWSLHGHHGKCALTHTHM